MKRLRAFAVLLTLVSLASLSTVLAQPNFELPLTVTDGANTYTLYIGVFPGAHFGVDPTDIFGTHAESELPPAPPTGVFDARMVFPRTGVDPGPPAGFGQGTLYDYRPYLSLAQADTFKGKNQTGTGPGIVVSWNSTDVAARFVAARLVDAATGGILINVNMLTASTADLGASGQTDFKIFTSGLVTPPNPGPTFSVSPTSLAFGNRLVGSNTTFTLTVSNTGATNALILNSAPTAPAGYTVTPNPPATFPLTIAALGSQNFDVVFNPPSVGPFNGDIVFTHNGVPPGPVSPTNVPVTGAGVAAPPSPIFSVSPTSLGFGPRGVLSSTTLTLTVSNTGTPNALILNSAPTVPAGYTITPNPPATFPLTIAALGSYNFDVVFHPPSVGTFNGDIVFTHNGVPPGPVSPTSVPVTGSGVSNALLFAADTRTHFEDFASYEDTLQLAYGGPGPLKALQVRLVFKGDDTSGLSLQGVTRGTNLPAGTFSFQTQAHYGPANMDGTTNDTVSIVFYGNGNNTIPPGANLNDLIRFRYGVGHVSPHGPQTVHVQLLDVFASLPNGDAVAVSADNDQNVIINPRGVHGYLYGDVNHDGSVDIIDLLLIVDYILGRPIVGTFDFTLGDLAPWVPGNPAPSPDGVINVQDLALLQQIILTGRYPDGSPSYAPVVPPIVANNNTGLQKGNSGADVKLTFYITNEGIAVRMANSMRVKGLQFEFGNIPSVPTNIDVMTLLGLGPYLGIDDLLRILMYNMEARTIEPGDRLVANIPFALANPNVVTLNRFVVAGEQNDRIGDVEIQIIHGTPPELPVDYLLSQNYPNPFNPTTNIKFAIPQAGNVKIAVYNLLGQEVRTLVSSYVDRGTGVVSWDGRDNNGKMASTGMYIYRMTSGSFVQSLKMMFMK